LERKELLFTGGGSDNRRSAVHCCKTVKQIPVTVTLSQCMQFVCVVGNCNMVLVLT